MTSCRSVLLLILLLFGKICAFHHQHASSAFSSSASRIRRQHCHLKHKHVHHQWSRVASTALPASPSPTGTAKRRSNSHSILMLMLHMRAYADSAPSVSRALFASSPSSSSTSSSSSSSTETNENDSNENSPIREMATFLTLRLGTSLLKSVQQQKKQQEQQQQKEQPVAVVTEAYGEIRAGEQPKKLHKREGDRVVALGDDFFSTNAPQDDHVDVDVNVDEHEDETILTQKDVTAIDQLVVRATASEADPVTTRGLVPEVVSLEFGKPLQVVESHMPALSEPLRLKVEQEEDEEVTMMGVDKDRDDEKNDEADTAVDTATALTPTSDSVVVAGGDGVSEKDEEDRDAFKTEMTETTTRIKWNEDEGTLVVESVPSSSPAAAAAWSDSSSTDAASAEAAVSGGDGFTMLRSSSSSSDTADVVATDQNDKDFAAAQAVVVEESIPSSASSTVEQLAGPGFTMMSIKEESDVTTTATSEQQEAAPVVEQQVAGPGFTMMKLKEESDDTTADSEQQTLLSSSLETATASTVAVEEQSEASAAALEAEAAWKTDQPPDGGAKPDSSLVDNVMDATGLALDNAQMLSPGISAWGLPEKRRESAASRWSQSLDSPAPQSTPTSAYLEAKAKKQPTKWSSVDNASASEPIAASRSTVPGWDPLGPRVGARTKISSQPPPTAATKTPSLSTAFGQDNTWATDSKTKARGGDGTASTTTGSPHNTSNNDDVSLLSNDAETVTANPESGSPAISPLAQADLPVPGAKEDRENWWKADREVAKFDPWKSSVGTMVDYGDGKKATTSVSTPEDVTEPVTPDDSELGSKPVLATENQAGYMDTAADLAPEETTASAALVVDPSSLSVPSSSATTTPYSTTTSAPSRTSTSTSDSTFTVGHWSGSTWASCTLKPSVVKPPCDEEYNPMELHPLYRTESGGYVWYTIPKYPDNTEWRKFAKYSGIHWTPPDDENECVVGQSE